MNAVQRNSGGDCKNDFVSVIMRSNDLFQMNIGEYGSFDQSQTLDIATFNQFHNFTCDLVEIDTAVSHSSSFERKVL